MWLWLRALTCDVAAAGLLVAFAAGCAAVYLSATPPEPLRAGTAAACAPPPPGCFLAMTSAVCRLTMCSCSHVCGRIVHPLWVPTPGACPC
jgi:hypothetical protein